MRRVVIAVGFAIASLLSLRTGIEAAPNFEGTWSVLIITEAGECDRAYRYPVKIANGAVTYLGVEGINFSGNVERNGRVRVSISRGERSATGSGHLADGRGSGTWSGRSATITCRGRWEAERRSS